MNAGQPGAGLAATLAEIRDLQSQFEIFRFLRRETVASGYEAFLVMHLPVATSLTLAENSVITNLPAQFLSAFDRANLLASSPLVDRLRRSTRPFAFSREDLVASRSGQDAENAAAIYADLAYSSGACIPVHDAEARRGAVILAGNRAQAEAEELARLTMVAIDVHQRLTEVATTQERPDQPLTDREIACLTWTAAGKTSADIAAILSLSEHTVNHYLNRAAKKLDTVNRTQAVAKALRRGLIR